MVQNKTLHKHATKLINNQCDVQICDDEMNALNADMNDFQELIRVTFNE